jgi:hypothetical protein
VTLDTALTFHAPPPELWTRPVALFADALGQPAGAESRCVVEVKATGEAPPAWLGESLHAAGAERAPYSKFERASEAVHDA